MNISIVERRFTASMLSGLAAGACVIGLLFLLWPSGFGGPPPVLVALLGVLSLAGGAFGALVWLNQYRQDG